MEKVLEEKEAETQSQISSLQDSTIKLFDKEKRFANRFVEKDIKFSRAEC